MAAAKQGEAAQTLASLAQRHHAADDDGRRTHAGQQLRGRGAGHARHHVEPQAHDGEPRALDDQRLEHRAGCRGRPGMGRRHVVGQVHRLFGAHFGTAESHIENNAPGVLDYLAEWHPVKDAHFVRHGRTAARWRYEQIAHLLDPPFGTFGDRVAHHLEDHFVQIFLNPCFDLLCWEQADLASRNNHCSERIEIGQKWSFPFRRKNETQFGKDRLQQHEQKEAVQLGYEHPMASEVPKKKTRQKADSTKYKTQGGV